jgi:hypothetical protein
MRKAFPLLFFILSSLWATSPRLTNGINLGGGSNEKPCHTAAACAANVGAEILFERVTSSGGCHQIWSMNTTGGNLHNLSANLIANGGFLVSSTQQITVNLNQGAPVYDTTGNWVMFSYQKAGTGSCVGSLTAGTGIDNGVAICAITTTAGVPNLTNCAGVLSCPYGCLHPQWTNDGTKIFFGLLYGAGSGGSPWNETSKLQWATFTAGTPPTVSAFTGVDPQGDGTGLVNNYEPWDSDGWTGSTCRLYYQTTIIPSAPSLNYFGIAYYDICKSTTGFVSTAYEPASSVNTTATQGTPGATTITVPSTASGITAGMIAVGAGLESTPIYTEVTNVSGQTITISPGTTAAMSGTPVSFYTPCFSEFWAINPVTHDTAITTSGCPYATAGWADPGYSVLDIVMAQAQTGYGMNQLTGYNLVGQPEYAYPVETSSPQWSFDGSFIIFTVCANCTLQYQMAGFPEPGITVDLWRYNMVNVQLLIDQSSERGGKYGQDVLCHQQWGNHGGFLPEQREHLDNDLGRGFKRLREGGRGHGAIGRL